MTSLRKIAALASAGALTSRAAGRCSSGSSDGASSARRAGGEPVTITVAGLLPTADDAAKQQLAERVTSFEDEVPEHQGRDRRTTSGSRRRSPPSSPVARCRTSSRSR